MAVWATTALLPSLAAGRSLAYWRCGEAFKSFDPEMSDEEIARLKGHVSVELCRLAGGAKAMLGHCLSKPAPRGRDRTRKLPIQLK